MRESDIVEIHQIAFTGMFKEDRWLGALVIAVDGERFLARLLRGTFDEEGHTEKWFSMQEAGNQWR